MGRRCWVPSCTTKEGKGSKIRLFPLPTNAEWKDKWLKAIGNPNFQPTRSTFICCKHFSESAFIARPDEETIQRLRFDAVPSLFLPSSEMTPSLEHSKKVREVHYTDLRKIKEENEFELSKSIEEEKGFESIKKEENELNFRKRKEDKYITVYQSMPRMSQKADPIDSCEIELEIDASKVDFIDPTVFLRQSLDENYNKTRDVSVQTELPEMCTSSAVRWLTILPPLKRHKSIRDTFVQTDLSEMTVMSTLQKQKSILNTSVQTDSPPLLPLPLPPLLPFPKKQKSIRQIGLSEMFTVSAVPTGTITSTLHKQKNIRNTSVQTNSPKTSTPSANPKVSILELLKEQISNRTTSVQSNSPETSTKSAIPRKKRRVIIPLNNRTVDKLEQTVGNAISAAKIFKLRGKIKILNQKLRRQNNIITKLKLFKASIKKKGLAYNKSEDALSESRHPENELNINREDSSMKVEHCYSKKLKISNQNLECYSDQLY